MNRLNRVALGLGLVLALVAGGVVFLALRAAREQAPLALEVQPVVVAAADIPAGTLLDASNVPRLLAVRREPAAAVPDGALTSTASAEGRTTSVALRAGDRVLAGDLGASTTGSGASLAALIPQGQVAIVLPASDQVSVAGAVRPADRVDLVASVPVRQPNGSQVVVTQALLKDIVVLATGAQTTASRGALQEAAPTAPYSTLTIALAPQDALVVQHLLSANVRLAMVLHRPDMPAVDTRPVTMDEVIRRFGLDQAPP